jgi:hypothetical protein
LLSKTGCLEHFRKNCSHSVGWEEAADLLGFGFVFTQSQALDGHAPSLKPHQKHQNLSLPTGSIFSSNAPLIISTYPDTLIFNLHPAVFSDRFLRND